MFTAELSADQRDLLAWLAREDYSQYGECHGAALDALIERGFAKVHEDGGELGSFIAKGRGPMYNSISLTDRGRIAVLEMTGGGMD